MAAYNRSRATVLRHEKLLKQLAANRRTMRIPAEKPINLAYRIREAMEAVKSHEDFDSQYGDLRDVYRVKAFEHYVEVRFLGEKEVEHTQKELDVPDELPSESPSPTVETPNAIQIENIVDLLGVIGTAIKLGDRTNEIFFPDAIIPLYAERLKLYTWCKTKGWKYIDHEGAGITLTKNDVDEFILWEPEETEGAEQ